SQSPHGCAHVAAPVARWASAHRAQALAPAGGAADRRIELSTPRRSRDHCPAPRGDSPAMNEHAPSHRPAELHPTHGEPSKYDVATYILAAIALAGILQLH